MAHRQKLVLFLIKKQAVEGTPEPSLVAANYIWVTSESKIAPDIPETELDTTGNGFDQIASVLGREKASADLKMYLRNNGTGVTPEIEPLMAGAGFAMTENAGFYIFRASNTITTDLTIWGYSGNLIASASNLEKIGNVKLNLNLSFDFANDVVCMLTFTGVGRYVAVPAAESQPAVTKLTNKVPALKGVTFSIMGSAEYIPLSLEIDCNQTVEDQTFPTDASGVGMTDHVEKKHRFTMKCYLRPAATNNPLADWKAETEGAFTLYYGAGPLIKLDAAATRITNVSPDTDGGYQTYTVEGQILQNALGLRLAGGEASSSSST